MSLLSKLINFIQQPWLLKAVLIAAACWLALDLLCCIFGAIGLFAIGRRKEMKPYLPAFLPGGQVWYTLHLVGKDRLARRAELLLWWCPTLAVAGFAAIVWAAYYYVADGGVLVFTFLALAVLLLVVALVFYIWIRMLEFRGLSRIFTRQAWIVSLIGTILCVPVQRVLLFSERKNLLKEGEQSD